MKHSGTRCIYHVLDSLSFPYDFSFFPTPILSQICAWWNQSVGPSSLPYMFSHEPPRSKKKHDQQKCFAFLYGNAQGCILSVFIILFTIVFCFSFRSVFFGLSWSTPWCVLSQKGLFKLQHLQCGTQTLHFGSCNNRVWKCKPLKLGFEMKSFQCTAFAPLCTLAKVIRSCGNDDTVEPHCKFGLHCS